MRLLLALLLGMTGVSYAQTSRTLFFDATGKVTSQANAAYYSVITQDKKDTTLYVVTTFHSSRVLLRSGSYRGSRYPISWEKLHQPGFFDALQEGKHAAFNPRGHILFEGNFISGLGEGKHRRWYETGKIMSEVTLVNGREEGMVRSWYETGQLQMQYETKNGRMDGEVMEWTEQGKKKRSATMQNGNMVGKLKRYTEREQEIPEP